MSQESPKVTAKSFADGAFLLFRKDGTKIRRPGIKGDRSHPPRFRHATYEAAEGEARRLLGKLPDSTFIILQEVGRVKRETSS